MDPSITILNLQLVNTWPQLPLSIVHNDYKGDNKALWCCSLINTKKFTITTPFVSLARAEVFQPKNQTYKAMPKNPKLFDRKVGFRMDSQSMML